MRKRNKHKNMAAVLAILLGFAGLPGCAARTGTDETPADAENADASKSATTAAPYLDFADEEDLESAWDAATSVKIVLNKTSVSIDGEGAKADGSVVTISEAGTYVLTGALQNGGIVVAATADDTVRLVLNGIDISNLTGAPIYASRCDKLIVTLADGTENLITDGGKDFVYANENESDEEPNAAVFGKGDLTINGSGTLTVNAGYSNGIGTNDNLIVAGGNLIINAANHGLRGNDSVTVLAGSIKIDAAADGVQTNNDTDAEKGWIYMADGAFDIIAGGDGIQAEAGLYVDDGAFNIVAGDGSDGTPTAVVGETATADVDASAESDSFKGIKATNISVSGGDFIIDSADDAMHSNADIAIGNGKFALATGDDGIHADGDLRIDGGEIMVRKSYEGLEAANVYITDGTIGVIASDDGINAAGGNDGNAADGRFGGDNFRAGGDYSVNISGGNVKVLAGSDGVDSNGALNVNGGHSVVLSNAERDGDALDAQNAITFTGGVMIYGGSLSTGGNPSGDSTQSYVYVEADIAAGSEINVKKEGKSLIAFNPDTDCRRLAISSPDIVNGETYEIYSGADLIATVTAGIGGGTRNEGPGRSGTPGGEPPTDERSEGGMPGGERPEGEMPGGERPEGGMPGGERPEGGMPGGERPEGGMPGGRPPTGGDPEGVGPGGDQPTEGFGGEQTPRSTQ
jgi:hypothetical protein